MLCFLLVCSIVIITIRTCMTCSYTVTMSSGAVFPTGMFNCYNNYNVELMNVLLGDLFSR